MRRRRRIGAGHRWVARPVASAMVRAAVLVVPAVSGAGAGVALGRALSGHIGGAPAAGIALGVSALVAVGVETVARRLLPLAALLKLSLAFPDRAPSRFRVARQAGNTRVLHDRVAHARAAGVADDPARAAEEILALVAALSAHDRKTRGHSERVRGFTDLLADELAIPLADRDRLRWAALLHDIGKLEVPAATLNKPGKPDAAEWELLRRHPLEGQRIVGGLLPWLESWGAVIAQHHERFDGAGYPNGLAGEQIHLGARIVAVADSFEVMTAARSYKRPMTPSAARRELAACAGKQFDPVVVRAMFSISLGRLWWRVGPASWIAQVPFMLGIGRAGSEAVAVVRTGSEVAVRAVSALLAVTLSGATGAAASPAAPTAAQPRSGVRTSVVRTEAGASSIPAVPGRTIDRREPPSADGGEAPAPATEHEDPSGSTATPAPEPQPTAASTDAGATATDAVGATVNTATDAVSDTTRAVADRVNDTTDPVSDVAASATPVVDATLDQATTTVTDTTTGATKEALAPVQPPDTGGLLGR